jgi:hypothetical protein
VSNYRSIPDPQANVESLHQTVLALKETVEVLAGHRKSLSAQALTYEDLVLAGVTTPYDLFTRKLITADEMQRMTRLPALQGLPL